MIMKNMKKSNQDVTNELQKQSTIAHSVIKKYFLKTFSGYGFHLVLPKNKWIHCGNAVDHFHFSKCPAPFQKITKSKTRVVGIDLPLLVKPIRKKITHKIAIIGQAPSRNLKELRASTATKKKFQTNKVVLGPAYGVGASFVIQNKTNFYARIILSLLNANCEVYLTDTRKIFTNPGNVRRHALLDFEILNREIQFLESQNFRFIALGKDAEEVLTGANLGQHMVAFKHPSSRFNNRTQNRKLSEIQRKIKKSWGLSTAAVFR